MQSDTELDDFLQKWRAAWPEWPLAQVFVPQPQRTASVAWLALRLEWIEAAWGGEDATPGFAKLGWWQEELRGWGKGVRRHPLGRVLQRSPAPWTMLADALDGLRSVRAHVLAGDADSAAQGLRTFATAFAVADAAVFGLDKPGTADAYVALAERLLWHAPSGDAATDRKRRSALLNEWTPAAGGSRAVRIHAAFVRRRLRTLAVGGAVSPLAPPTALWTAWRAARA